jgi:hypothetical protein
MYRISAENHGSGMWAATRRRWRHVAWIILLIADAGLLAWGAGAAAIPNHLPGPGGTAILRAGYQGYSGGTWHQLASRSPDTAGYITLVFRMYGIYIVAFSLLALAIAATAFRRGERWAWWGRSWWATPSPTALR